ncbi:rhomboid family intramembrane serine protease [Chloroflexota bacterium]
MVYRGYRGFNLNPVWLVIFINLLVFIAYMINSRLIISLLGLQPVSFLDKPWSLVTSLFVHAGFWHIIANMLTFYFFGNAVATLIGMRNLLIVYFCGGIVGSIFYLILGHPFITAVGASGAVFTLGGILTVLRPKLRVFVFPIPAPIPLWVAIVGGFVILFPFSAWQGHLGGLVFGLIAGLFFRKRGRRFF